MGKAKKELTNQRRAARLGTGQGIAPSRGKTGGGIPPWAWFVGGSVVLAAAIIAVAVIATRSSSSAATKGQSAAVVQDRLSHSKIDFTSQGTWPLNDTNLDGALTALNLSSNPSASLAVHYHWHLDLYAGGHHIIIPRNIGLQNPPGLSSDVHTHDVAEDAHGGIIHVESARSGFKSTVLDVFDVWGVYASNQCIGGYCGGVKVYVDGQISPAGLQTEPTEHAEVTVVAGSLPPGVKPAVKYTGFAPGE